MPGPTFFELARSIDNELKGNFRYPMKVVTAAGATVLTGASDAQVEFDATLGAQLAQLPDATLNKGMFFFIKKSDASANTVTIECLVGGQMIDGVASQTLVAQFDFLVVASNGVGYSVYSSMVTPVTPGSALYVAKGISKTDGISTLDPVDGTLINFQTTLDGVCIFWAKVEFSGLSIFPSATIAVKVDGTNYQLGVYTIQCGSGDDHVSNWTLSGSIPLLLNAGAHTVEVVVVQGGLAAQASAGQPLTVSVMYPGAVVTSTTLAPEAARVRTSGSTDINPAATLSFDTIDANDGALFNAGAPTKMTAQFGGWYIFESQLLTDAGMDGSFRSLKIRKNGTTIVAEDRRDDFVHNATQRSLRVQSGPLLLAPGDFVEVVAETDAVDSGQNTVAADDYSVVFSGARLIPGSIAADISVRLSILANVSVPDATPTTLEWDITDYDTGLFFSGGSPSKITIPVDGKYDLFVGPILWDDGTGSRSIFVSKNGAASVGVSTIPAPTGALAAHEANVRGISCTAGDYFEVSVYQDSGGPININTDAGVGNIPVFYAKKVA